MAIEDKDLFAAVTAGIGQASSTTEPADETADETVLDTGGETPTGDDAGTDADAALDDGAGAEGEQEGDGDADATGDGEGDPNGEGEGERDPTTGRFLPKKAVAGEQPAKPDGKAAAAKAPGTKDPINDPIPVELKKETRERMVTLVNTAKTLTAERDQYKATNDELMGMIQETKASPQQYGQALDYLRVVNGGNVEEIKKLIPFLQGELTALCRMAGVSVAGVDLLADHADLKQAVADGGMSKQHAEEIAAARDQRRMQQTATQHVQQTREQQAEAKRQGIADLNALEVELKGQDPLFDKKRPLILQKLRTPDPRTGRTPIESTPPHQWPQLFLKHYALTKLAPPKTGVLGAKPGAKVPTNQPLRARQPAGGATAAPKSALEAVMQGISSVSR